MLTMCADLFVVDRIKVGFFKQVPKSLKIWFKAQKCRGFASYMIFWIKLRKELNFFCWIFVFHRIEHGLNENDEYTTSYLDFTRYW